MEPIPGARVQEKGRAGHFGRVIEVVSSDGDALVEFDTAPTGTHWVLFDYLEDQ